LGTEWAVGLRPGDARGDGVRGLITWIAERRRGRRGGDSGMGVLATLMSAGAVVRVGV
jgi:hypothetical protein